MTQSSRGAFDGVFDRFKQAKNAAGELLPPAPTLRFMTGFEATYDAGSEEIRVVLSDTTGFAFASTKLLAPSGAAMTVNGAAIATLAADVTLQVLTDNSTLKIASNTLQFVNAQSVTADPKTLALRTYTGDAGPAAIHGQGALLAVRFVAGSIDDVPARSGALGVAAEAAAVAFRNAADDGDLTALGSEAGDIVTIGDLTTPPTITKLYSCDALEVYNCPDAVTTLHCSFIPQYNGCFAGPIVRYSNAMGNNAQHIYPAAGAFNVLEDGGAATLRATIDDSGVDLPSAGAYQIGAAALVSVAAGVETFGSAGAPLTIQAAGGEELNIKNGAFVAAYIDNTAITLAGAHTFTATELGFFGAGAVVKPTVSGSRGGNAALTSLLTALANLGLITDSTT